MIGAIDMVPVQREPFVQWVMEDVPGALGPDWAAAGVTLTRDVAGYEQAKLRILNGAHSTLAYLGLLRGRQTTREAMADAPLAAFVRELVMQDIAPSLTPPPGLDIAAYIETVLQRIANPAITHHLGQIAWDGSQKLPYRLFGALEAALTAGRPDRAARACRSPPGCASSASARATASNCSTRSPRASTEHRPRLQRQRCTTCQCSWRWTRCSPRALAHEWPRFVAALVQAV